MRSRKSLRTIMTAVLLVVLVISTWRSSKAATAAFWSSGTTYFEMLELKEVICTTDSHDNWVINVTVKNLGVPNVTLMNLYVNETAAMLGCSAPNASVYTLTTDLNRSQSNIQKSEEDTITVWIGAINARPNVTFTQGSIVNLKIPSSAGAFYSVLLELDSGAGFIEKSGFKDPPSIRKPGITFYGTPLIFLIGIGILWRSSGILGGILGAIAKIIAILLALNLALIVWLATSIVY